MKMAFSLLNKKAPDFVLKNQDGEKHKLSDYIGNWILIYFYPKDNTPGCTIEACSIRDNFPFFEKLDAIVFGISIDSVSQHKNFSNKYNLPFNLLADENKDVVNKYGVWKKKKLAGKEYMGIVRSSFLIDPNGIIVKVYDKVKPETHASEVLADLKELQ